jgi:hypothetical protein
MPIVLNSDAPAEWEYEVRSSLDASPLAFCPLASFAAKVGRYHCLPTTGKVNVLHRDKLPAV